MAISRYVWDCDSDNIITEMQSGPIARVTYTREPFYHGAIISATRNTGDIYWHADGQGSARQVTSLTSALIESFIYTAGGSLVLSAEPSVHFTFAGDQGYYRDTITETYYIRHRYYDPELARWMSADSQCVEEMIPVCVSALYSYVQSNPVNDVDPTGLALPLPPGPSERPWWLECTCGILPGPGGAVRPIPVKALCKGAVTVVGAGLGIEAARRIKKKPKQKPKTKSLREHRKSRPEPYVPNPRNCAEATAWHPGSLTHCSDVPEPNAETPQEACKLCNPGVEGIKEFGGKPAKSIRDYFGQPPWWDQMHYDCGPGGKAYPTSEKYTSVVCGSCCAENENGFTIKVLCACQ